VLKDVLSEELGFTPKFTIKKLSEDIGIRKLRSKKFESLETKVMEYETIDKKEKKSFDLIMEYYRKTTYGEGEDIEIYGAELLDEDFYDEVYL
jgi:hypothetical protein